MSGETGDSVSGWTVDTLKDHYDKVLEMLTDSLHERYESQTSAINAALVSAEKAVTKAETAAEKRFDSVNEFRHTLSDQATQFISRNEALAAIDRNTERVQELVDRFNIVEGRESATPTVPDQVHQLTIELASLREERAAGVGRYTGANVESKVNELSVLVSRQSDAIAADQGKSQGLNQAWGYLVGAVGLISTIIVLAIRASGN